jgi:hypothetical protein
LDLEIRHDYGGFSYDHKVIHKLEWVLWNRFPNEWTKGYGFDEMVLPSFKEI